MLTRRIRVPRGTHPGAVGTSGDTLPLPHPLGGLCADLEEQRILLRWHPDSRLVRAIREHHAARRRYGDRNDDGEHRIRQHLELVCYPFLHPQIADVPDSAEGDGAGLSGETLLDVPLDPVLKGMRGSLIGDNQLTVKDKEIELLARDVHPPATVRTASIERYGSPKILTSGSRSTPSFSRTVCCARSIRARASCAVPPPWLTK